MIIKTRQDWIDLAKTTAPKMPEYMAEFSGAVDPGMVEAEMERLLTAEDWEGLHGRFEEIWPWLPDSPDIRHHPFGDLCDLCSEGWAIYEEVEP